MDIGPAGSHVEAVTTISEPPLAGQEYGVEPLSPSALAFFEDFRTSGLSASPVSPATAYTQQLFVCGSCAVLCRLPAEQLTYMLSCLLT